MRTRSLFDESDVRVFERRLAGDHLADLGALELAQQRLQQLGSDARLNQQQLGLVASLAGATALLGLVASLVGWVATPARRTWLEFAPSENPQQMPPQTHQA